MHAWDGSAVLWTHRPVETIATGKRVCKEKEGHMPGGHTKAIVYEKEMEEGEGKLLSKDRDVHGGGGGKMLQCHMCVMCHCVMHMWTVLSVSRWHVRTVMLRVEDAAVTIGCMNSVVQESLVRLVRNQP